MRMLDLYCGEGLAAWGYWLSGRFSEIVGVDINPKMSSSYSFNFICGNALALDYDFLSGFDFIHASPPCQAYSKMTPSPGSHMRLIAATHQMLYASGKPYVIENVEGSGKELKPNLVMNGHYFGLPMERRRYFHVSTLVPGQRLISSGQSINVHGQAYVSRDEIIEAMGLWMINEKRLRNLSMTGMEQGVPPVMTKHIAEMMFAKKFMICEKLGSFSYS